MTKLAIQFDIEIHEQQGQLTAFRVINDYDTEGFKLVSDDVWLYDSIDPEYDFIKPFVELDEDVSKMEINKPYHVFQYGTGEFIWSEGEYGRECDGFEFTPEYTRVSEIK
jgi:hypothetical protein